MRGPCDVLTALADADRDAIPPLDVGRLNRVANRMIKNGTRTDVGRREAKERSVKRELNGMSVTCGVFECHVPFDVLRTLKMLLRSTY